MRVLTSRKFENRNARSQNCGCLRRFMFFMESILCYLLDIINITFYDIIFYIFYAVYEFLNL